MTALSTGNKIADLNCASLITFRSGLEPLLKKRDRFKGSSAQCIAERFTLELHLDEGDLNGAVRHVWMNVLHAGEPGKIRTAIPTGL